MVEGIVGIVGGRLGGADVVVGGGVEVVVMVGRGEVVLRVARGGGLGVGGVVGGTVGTGLVVGVGVGVGVVVDDDAMAGRMTRCVEETAAVGTSFDARIITVCCKVPCDAHTLCHELLYNSSRHNHFIYKLISTYCFIIIYFETSKYPVHICFKYENIPSPPSA